MTAQTSKFNSILSQFSQPHHRWENLRKLVFQGIKIGMSCDELITTIRDVGVTNRDSDIRETWGWAMSRSPKTTHQKFYPQQFKPSPSVPNFVSQMIQQGDRIQTSNDLFALSPQKVSTLNGIEASTAQIGAMFLPTDMIFIGNMDNGINPILGKNLKQAKHWIDRPQDIVSSGCQIKINPFSGKECPKQSGNGSTLIGQSCISRFPNLLIEFDELPLRTQCQFWGGMILSRKIPIICLVYSGNKSIHGLLRVGAQDLSTWRKRCAEAKCLFCTAPNRQYRADIQALHPEVGMRLSGILRKDTNRRQKLLFLSETTIQISAEGNKI